MKKHILWVIKFAIPVIGFGLAIWSTFFIGDDRQLSYEIVSTTEIDSIKSEHLPGIQIKYGGENIERGGIVTIRVANTGDTPIYSKEFDGPIEIRLDSKSMFIDSKVVNVSPSNLKPSLLLNNGAINIAPLLLNSSDSITIQSLAKGSVKNISVTGRIGGINKIEDINKNKSAIFSGFSWLLVIYAVFCFVSYSLVGPVVLGGRIVFENRSISHRGAILIVAIVMLSGIVALTTFTEIHDIKIGWSSLAYFLGLLVISEFIAIPFRVKESKNVGEE